MGAVGDGKCYESKGNISLKPCHTVTTRELQDSQGTAQIVEECNCKEVVLPHTIRFLFEQDFAKNKKSRKPLSQEDIKFMTITTEGIRKTADNHYKIPLLLAIRSLPKIVSLA